MYTAFGFSFIYLQGGHEVPAAKVAFSSYPASLFSGDDYYALSSGLIVQETTIGNKYVVAPPMRCPAHASPIA